MRPTTQISTVFVPFDFFNHWLTENEKSLRALRVSWTALKQLTIAILGIRLGEGSLDQLIDDWVFDESTDILWAIDLDPIIYRELFNMAESLRKVLYAYTPPIYINDFQTIRFKNDLLILQR